MYEHISIASYAIFALVNKDCAPPHLRVSTSTSAQLTEACRPVDGSELPHCPFLRGGGGLGVKKIIV